MKDILSVFNVARAFEITKIIFHLLRGNKMKAIVLFTFISIILFSCNSKPIENAEVESTMLKD
jgi:hypothetical protein